MTAPSKFAQFAAQPSDMRGALIAALVALALRDPDPVERAAKLEILRRDGWI